MATENDDILRLAMAEADKVRVEVRQARTPPEFERVITNFHNVLDWIFNEMLTQYGSPVACHKGCSFCCYINVDAQPLEIFRIVAFLSREFSKSQIDSIQQKAMANRERIRAMSLYEQANANIACPLLKDNSCGCYEVRPMMCRKHHARQMDHCERMFRQPEIECPDVEIPAVVRPLAATIVMTQTAFEEEGFDSRPYDLSSALAEALTNPKCYKRWRDKRKAFRGDIVAKDWAEAQTQGSPHS